MPLRGEASGLLAQIEGPKVPQQSDQETYSEAVSSDLASSTEKDHRRKRRPLSFLFEKAFWDRLCLMLSLLVGIAWLAPIIILFVVNIKSQSIGAQAWCLGSDNCGGISYNNNSNTSTSSYSSQLDTDNHNLIGALQYAGTVLEIWHFWIATSLVWYVTVLLARTKEGIPLGYFMTHKDFMDLHALADHRLYSAAGLPRILHQGRSLKVNFSFLRHRLFYFVGFVIFMCLIANVMGPSINVLLIPTLYWNDDMDLTNSNQFTAYLAAQPPFGDSAIPGCNATQLQHQEYDCTGYIYESALEALITAMNQEDDQYFNNLSLPHYAVDYPPGDTARLLEQSIPFSFNLSTNRKSAVDTDTIYSPSRQALRDLNADFLGLYNVILGETSDPTLLERYGRYIGSSDLLLRTKGPVIAMSYLALNTIHNVTVTDLGDERSIRCYNGFSEDGSMAKCMRVGTAWNTSNAVTEFFLGAGAESDLGMKPVQATAFWADMALYTDFPPSDECLQNGTSPDLFENCSDYYDQKFANRSSPDVGDQFDDMFVIEYSCLNCTTPNLSLIVQFFPQYGFGMYEIDVTSIDPSLPPVTIPDPPMDQDLRRLAIHPAWFLAAWAVNPNGKIEEFSHRGYYTQLAVNNILFPSLEDADEDPTDSHYRLFWYNFYAMGQTASLIPYNTSTLTPAQLQNISNLPTFQPALGSVIYNQAWSWGLSSGVSMAALTVCCLGILVTLARTVLLLSFRFRIPSGSGVSMLAPAIRHGNEGAFNAGQVRHPNRDHYRVLQQDDGEIDEYDYVPDL